MIYDTDENPITSTAIMVPPDELREFSLLIDCKTGYSITAETDNADVGIFGKAAPGDAWTDLLTGAIDTGPFEPARKQFYFKIEVDAAADPATEIAQIIVARP